jgi:hypothetical protein
VFQVDYTDFVDAGSMLASELKRKGKISLIRCAGANKYEHILSKNASAKKDLWCCGTLK